MAIDFASVALESNTGFDTTINDDYVKYCEFDDDMIFVSIADGQGAKENGSQFRPAAIVTNRVQDMLKRMYQKNRDVFLENIRFFIEEAFLAANDVLVAFKIANEEAFMGFSSTLTCALIQRNGKVTFGHVGNTRLYLIKNSDGKIRQLTKDHTIGQQMVDRGQMDEEEYYTSIERLRFYNGFGVMPTPEVQTFSFTLNPQDLLVMTTDGIHYSYKPSTILNVLMLEDVVTAEDAAKKMIDTALDLKNFKDNISANVIWYFGSEKQQ